ncbi:unnamed protein product [Lymnaea stagnalis]|uniref:Uncharacterized protein n=1 Tax=Lymnaea stagnalis TaxID=6523 RepID=A0AAV2IEL8_LYMST
MAKATSCKFVPARISENTKIPPTPCLEFSAEQERINNIKQNISASDQLKFWAAKNEGTFSNKLFPSKDNRVHSSDKQEVQSFSSNSTLAAFLCKRSDVKSYFPVKKIDSCNSSPTLSITEVTIKNIRGPFRSRTPQEPRHSTMPRDVTLSPAPTLLSQISSLM